MKIAMLSTGEEVLHGDIDDTNASWLARMFFDAGFKLNQRITVGDALADIKAALIKCSQQFDIVIVNGGLGPTSDDLSSQAMAEAMEEKLVLNTIWLAEMEKYFALSARAMPKSNIKQAMLPNGAQMIPNPVGTACGFSARLNKALFFFTPGVPKEFKAMVKDDILPRLCEAFPAGKKMQLKRFYTFGLSESFLNDELGKPCLPSGAFLGYRSATPYIEVKLFAPEKQNIEKIEQSIVAGLGEHCLSQNKAILTELGERLLDCRYRFALLDKFTSGYFSYLASNNRNMQAVFLQSRILDKAIAAKNLNEVLNLAQAIKQESQTELGLACANLGQTRVGLALVAQDKQFACELEFTRKLKSREQQEYICAVMFEMLRRYCLGLDIFPKATSLQIRSTM